MCLDKIQLFSLSLIRYGSMQFVEEVNAYPRYKARFDDFFFGDWRHMRPVGEYNLYANMCAGNKFDRLEFLT